MLLLVVLHGMELDLPTGIPIRMRRWYMNCSNIEIIFVLCIVLDPLKAIAEFFLLFLIKPARIMAYHHPGIAVLRDQPYHLYWNIPTHRNQEK